MGDSVSNLNEELYDGLHESTSDRRFFGLRIGIWNEEQISNDLREKIKLESVIKTVNKKQLESIVEMNFYNWLFDLAEIVNNSKMSFSNAIKILASYFIEVNSFKPLNFISIVIDIMNAMQIHPKQIDIAINDIIRNQDYELGLVKSFENDIFTVHSTETLNLKETPIVVVKDLNGSTHIGIIINRTAHEFRAKILKTILNLGIKDKSKIEVLKGLDITIGSPIKFAKNEDLDPLFFVKDTGVISLELGFLPGVKNIKDEQSYPYNVCLKPGQNCNGAVIALSGRGKSNMAKVLLLQILKHNKKTKGKHKKIGGIVLDKHGEYHQDFNRIMDVINSKEEKELLCVDPYNNSKYRVTIEDIPIQVFLKKAQSPFAFSIIRDILQHLYSEEGGFTAPVSRNNIQRIDRFTVETLNHLLNTTTREIQAWPNFARRYNNLSLEAALRYIYSIKNYRNIIQANWNEGTQQFESITETENLFDILDDVQKNGFWAIVNCSGFNEEERTQLETLIISKVRNWREFLYSKNKRLFETYPLFYLINEEMTGSFEWMNEDDRRRHSDLATGARKFRMGYLYIFQTLDGVQKSVISQAAGFVAVFQVPQNNDRQDVLRKVPTDFTPYEFFIQNSGIGEAVMSNLVIDLPFPVKVYKFEDLRDNFLEEEISSEELEKRKKDFAM